MLLLLDSSSDDNFVGDVEEVRASTVKPRVPPTPSSGGGGVSIGISTTSATTPGTPVVSIRTTQLTKTEEADTSIGATVRLSILEQIVANRRKTTRKPFR